MLPFDFLKILPRLVRASPLPIAVPPVVVLKKNDVFKYSRPLNQMDGVFRNHFLQLCCLGLVLGLMVGCAGKQSAPSAGAGPAGLAALGYTIQAGAFAKVDNAFRLSSRLLDQGLPAYYFRGEAGLYRVRFGNYPSYDQALAAARRLEISGVIEVYSVIRPESYPAVRYRGQEEIIREQLVAVARQFIGVPYQWGDASPVEGFDCSGLAMMVYQLVGFDMPRISKDQFRRGREIGREQLRPGDLVFFATDRSGQVSHVGIYQGDDLFIHAPRSGKAVTRSALSSDYFLKHYLGARAFM